MRRTEIAAYKENLAAKTGEELKAQEK